MTTKPTTTATTHSSSDLDADLEREIARAEQIRADVTAGRLIPRSALAALFERMATALRQGINPGIAKNSGKAGTSDDTTR